MTPASSPRASASDADRPRIVFGVTGGIAAYKACEVLRLLTEAHYDVTVVPTRAALKFVGEPTWAALSGNRVRADLFDDVHEVAHVRLGQQADLVLVVPATADVLARAAHGLADDLLTNVLLTARGPVVFAPAMHTEMWNHPATVANVATLRSRGAIVIEPAVGRLTGLDSGAGRLPEPAEIAEVARRVLSRGRDGLRPDLVGRRVVVSAGGTREALDPVRFLGNRSSGRQGYALAMTAVARGAEVTLVSANVTLADPAGAKVVRVGSADELRSAVLEAAADADAVVMAAAVADFRPVTLSASKIKKSDADPPAVELTRNADVLAELGRADRAGRPAQVIVGFAAETDDVLANGRIKLASKGADLLVVNEVGATKGFDVAENAATILGADGTAVDVPAGPKPALADVVWDLVAARLPLVS
ncbi:MAG TPA: bifunctional phosphopantothenoylcysteine decarboxylase/phosphopantothenate--cysteine ligase CoaBC [Acidothermaceae bacterium]